MKIKNNHKQHKQCRISVIIFSGEANITYSDDIYDSELDIDTMFMYTGGGTTFEHAFSKIH